MKLKKNKKLIIIISVILLLAVAVTAGILINNARNKKEITLSEKKWIEENKKNMIDIYIMNDLPIFSKDEEDIFLSFLDYFEAETGLSLNRVSYSLSSSEPSSSYIFKIVKETDDISRNDLLFYDDNYVILSKENRKLQDLCDLEGYKIGVLTSNLASISEYLSYGNDLDFKDYEDSIQLFNDFNDDAIDYVVIPKNRYLEDIVNNNFYIVNNLSSLSNKYVLTISDDNTKLDSIFTKLFNKWYSNNFDKLYLEKMNDFYYQTKAIDDKTKSSFLSKKYIYGYVENIPYEINSNKGLNLEFIKGFEEFSGVEFQFKKYSSIQDLKEAFEAGEVDIIFNYYNFDTSSSNETINIYNGTYVILTYINNNVTVDSLVSLADKDIYALKDTALTNYINNNTKATVKAYTKVSNLLKNKEPLILLDLNTYNYYKNTKLKDYYIVFEGKTELDYNFLVKRDTTNNTFYDVFQYYLTNINHTEFINRGMAKIINNSILANLSFFSYLVFALLIVVFYVLFKRYRDIKLKKAEEKTRFIDPLTSLKNRNYLTYNMNKWDDNKVYPQAIIIIDLNGIKLINNENGYKEGDKVIKAAANILISNQLKNTDIMRTDGNEFMIYLVGYNEEQITLYIRKLYKLMKELPYGKGASLGKSMILDDMKLIEDAINEAVIEAKANKGK